MAASYRQAKVEDAKQIAENLREVDKDEIRATHGLMNFETVVHGSIRGSFDAKALVEDDGSIVCVFGVADHQHIEGVGVIWMLGTDRLNKYKRELVVHSKLYIKHCFERYDTLFNFIDMRNAVSIRWLKSIGFEFGEPVPFGMEQRLFYPFVLVNPEKQSALIEEQPVETL